MVPVKSPFSVNFRLWNSMGLSRTEIFSLPEKVKYLTCGVTETSVPNPTLVIVNVWPNTVRLLAPAGRSTVRLRNSPSFEIHRSRKPKVLLFNAVRTTDPLVLNPVSSQLALLSMSLNTVKSIVNGGTVETVTPANLTLPVDGSFSTICRFSNFMVAEMPGIFIVPV